MDGRYGGSDFDLRKLDLPFALPHGADAARLFEASVGTEPVIIGAGYGPDLSRPVGGMTGRQALALAKQAAAYVSAQPFGYIYLDFDMDVGDGYTGDPGALDASEDDAVCVTDGSDGIGRDEGTVFVVGVADFARRPDSCFPAGEALMPAIAIFHEVCGHGTQAAHESGKDDPLSMLLALNDRACAGSREYKGLFPYDTAAYRKQPYEVAARYMSLKVGTEFLRERGSREAADVLLREYCRHVLERGAECVDPGPGRPSPERILRAYEDWFAAHALDHREYSGDRPGEEHGLLASYEGRAGVMDLRAAVRDCRDGLVQDYIEASAYFQAHPWDGLKGSRALAGLALRAEDALEPGFRLPGRRTASGPVPSGESHAVRGAAVREHGAGCGMRMSASARLAMDGKPVWGHFFVDGLRARLGPVSSGPDGRRTADVRVDMPVDVYFGKYGKARPVRMAPSELEAAREEAVRMDARAARRLPDVSCASPVDPERSLG